MEGAVVAVADTAVVDIAIVMVHLHQVVMAHLQEAAVMAGEVDGVAVSINGR